ncbi:MAG TPA: winged helix-turn-helix domain-containing protein, partial [Streptosporangiaceae bacterium]
MTSELAALSGLDPDDPRPPSQQIANVLRAAIRTRKFEPGERLPSQNELAERYNVARETVKTALRILRDERLIVTRQGSGAFVRAQTERPVGLRPHVEAAFERPDVTIDFAGFS